MLGMDSPNAHLIQRLLGSILLMCGCGTKLPHGDDHHDDHHIWSMDNSCPQGAGLGFASGDTNPTIFGTTLTCFSCISRIVSNHDIKPRSCHPSL